jgi:hypothetical protein
VAKENTPHAIQPTKAIPVANMQNIPSSIWSFFSGLPLIPNSKAVAESWLSRGELWLVIFALIIGAGLLGEDRAERKEKSWIPPPPSGWNWKLIFAWFVIIGVIGELFCDAAIWVSSDALQAISDSETEGLRAENLAFQRILKPRRFPVFLPADKPELFQEYRDLEKNFAGAMLLIQSVPDMEAEILANDILVVLNGLKWKATLVGPSVTNTPPTLIQDGLAVHSRAVPKPPFKPSASIEKAKAAADALAKVFSDVGLGAGPFPVAAWDDIRPWAGKPDMFTFPAPDDVVLVTVGSRAECRCRTGGSITAVG